MVEQLEACALSDLEALAQSHAHAKEVRKVAQCVGTTVQVVARLTDAGTTRLRYSYAGVRMERGTLQALVCQEAACPQRAAVHRRWADRIGTPPQTATRKAAYGISRASLFEEVAMHAGPSTYVARPAALRCRTSCPEGAHAPLVMEKQGWDLFADGRYVEGGLVQGGGSADQVPMFPSIEHVRAWLEVTRVRERDQGSCTAR